MQPIVGIITLQETSLNDLFPKYVKEQKISYLGLFQLLRNSFWVSNGVIYMFAMQEEDYP